ncbi:MAG: methyltransferase domain-containing protein [Cyanothece sp. SIO1E1]|nr:methyltransferase domain-containing protein [Cyanothece sp. SIO1E1]
MPENHWNASLYEDKHAFVWRYGEDVVELLSPQPGEHILDLGCGTGQLTQKLAAVGAAVRGIDHAPAMIEQARRNYPHLRFAVADARDFQVEQPLDAVFSNAVLHWIQDAKAVMEQIGLALKPGGRFVAEFGGKGCVQTIITALDNTLKAMGYASSYASSPWYFPSISEYTTLLEQHGFKVTYATLFERPTPLEGGASGLANWLQMFASRFLSRVPMAQHAEVIQALEHRLRPVLYQQGSWIADYQRIRVVAIK